MFIKGSTKRGQELLARAINYEGYELLDVYNSVSRAKQDSFNWCYEKYLNTPESTDFHICSHNTFQYSVTWDGKYNGENATFIETANNSYVILLDKQASWCDSAGSIPALAIHKI